MLQSTKLQTESKIPGKIAFMTTKCSKVSAQNFRFNPTTISIGSSSTAYPSPSNYTERTLKKIDYDSTGTSNISKITPNIRNRKMMSADNKKISSLYITPTILPNRSKVYTKAIPKTEESNRTSSSYSQPSRGRLVHEDFLSDVLKVGTSSFGSSTSTSRSSSSSSSSTTKSRLFGGKQPKVSGIKNLNFHGSTGTMRTITTSNVENTKFVTISEKTSPNNYIRMTKNVNSTNFFMAKKNMSSKSFLSTLMPLNDLDIATYNKRKIQERKKAIYEQWKENNKNIGRISSVISHSVRSSSSK